MPENKRVLILGASGLIGNRIVRTLQPLSAFTPVPASSRSIPGYLHVPFDSLENPDDWRRLLLDNRITTVVNCVGIFKGGAEDFERTHYRAPVALFDACRQLNLLVIHISALGFSEGSKLAYVSTKVRADNYLLAHNSLCHVIRPSLVFGVEGPSSRFFLHLAALPLYVDIGYVRNLQPVCAQDVADVVRDVLLDVRKEKLINCAGPSKISMMEYLQALREGMGLASKPWIIRIPQKAAEGLFNIGERFGVRFINRQTWELLQNGTHDDREHPDARPYTIFASASDLRAIQLEWLYWFTRLGIGFIWVWTAAVSWFGYPRSESVAWLQRIGMTFHTEAWLAASCVLDLLMGIFAWFNPSRLLWRLQIFIVAGYSMALAIGLPEMWLHPFGPLTKNIAVLSCLAFLALQERR